jgi:hypothetical protein
LEFSIEVSSPATVIKASLRRQSFLIEVFITKQFASLPPTEALDEKAGASFARLLRFD